MTDALTRWYAALMRIPAAGYFGLFLVFPLLLALGATIRPLRTTIIEPFLWMPIVRDTGYNPVSTLVLILTALILLLWFLRLLKTYNQVVDMDWIVGILPFFAWGPMLRVLEDADLFAPYAETLAVHDASARATAPCSFAVPGSFLDQCLGVFLVTPPIWIWGCLLIFAWARLGRFGTDIGARYGLRAGLAFVGLLLGAHLLGHVLLYVLQPTWVRYVPSPWLTLLIAGVGFALVASDTRRHGLVRSRRVLLACALLPLGLTLPWIFAWFTGGHAEWRPTGVLRPWFLILLVVVPIALALALRHHGTELSRHRRAAKSARKHLAFLVYVVLIEAFLLYDGSVRLIDGIQRRHATSFMIGLVMIPAAVALGVYVVRGTRKGKMGAHPSMATFAQPLALLAVAAQFADALMTSLSLDVFRMEEKHVLPRNLINAVENIPELPGAALVMFLYKLPLSLLVVWWLDRRFSGGATAEDFNKILKMGIVAVGLVPAVRDGLRLAMGV